MDCRDEAMDRRDNPPRLSRDLRLDGPVRVLGGALLVAMSGAAILVQIFVACKESFVTFSFDFTKMFNGSIDDRMINR